MKKYIVFILIYISIVNTYAQVTYDWSKHIDQTSVNSTSLVSVAGIERDLNSNIFIVGVINGIVDLDVFNVGGVLTSYNFFGTYVNEPFIAKYDSVGNFLWGDVITGGTYVDGRAVSVSLDNMGNAYIVGDINNPGPSGKGFLAKYSPTGTRVFKIDIGGYPGIESEVVTVDNVGGVYVGYKFSGTVDFDPGPGVVSRIGAGSADNYLAKYSSATGAFQWVKIFGVGISFRDIEYDNLTNTIYTFGSFSGTQDFNPDAGVNNLTTPANSAFVAQYNVSTGAYVNAYAINTSSGSQGVWDMKIQGDDLYAVFLYSGTVDFQPGAGTTTLTAATNSIAIARYKKSTMQLSWVYPSPIAMGWGSPSIRIAMNGADKLMVYGEYTGTQDFNPGVGVANLTSASLGGSTFAAYSIDSSGNFVWAANIGDNSGNFRLFYHDLIADGKGGFYVAGDFDNDISLNPANNAITYNEGTGPTDSFLAHYIICQSGTNTTSLASICENQTKSLTSTSVGGTWSIVAGGGTISGTTYTPANVTVNTSVTIRYTDGCGNTSDRVFTVNVNEIASNTTAITAICETSTKTLVGSPTGGTWSVVSGGGTISGTTYTPANVATNTSVTVRYTIAANGTCSGSTSDIVFVVEPLYTSSITSSNGDMCNGDTRTLTATPTGGVWSVTSGSGSVTGTTLTATGASSPIQLQYRLTNSCGNMDATQSITISSTVTASITSSVASLCNNETRVLTGNPTGGTWVVLSGPGIVSGGTLTPNGSGTVRIKYDVTSSCGNGSDTVDIVINTTSTPNAGVDENICLGDTITLLATGGGTYQWVSGPATASYQVYPTVTTGYRVNITSDSSCLTSDTVTVFVQISGTAIAQNDQAIVLTGTQEIIDIYTNDVGGINTLNILSVSTHGTTILSGGNISYTSNSGYIGNDTVEYEICDANCLTVCDTAHLYIKVESDLIIPIGISPNGDGKNDEFNILGLSRYPDNNLSIYNRWGSLVYQAQPYLNNWNGQSTKGEVIEGTYFYILKLGENLPRHNGYIELKN